MSSEEIKNNKYIKGFKKDLKEFLDFLYNINNTDEIKRMIDNIDNINYKKLASYIFIKTKDISNRLKKHDETLFLEEVRFFPGINISIYFNKLNDDNKNIFWEKIVRLHIYTYIIVEHVEKNVKNELEKVDKNKLEEKEKELKVIGNKSLFDLIKEEEDNESDDEDDGFNLNKLISQVLDVDDFSEKIKNIDDDDINKITGTVSSILGDNINDKSKDLIKGMIKGVSEEVKDIDFKNGDIIENVQNLADKVSQKYINDKTKHNDIKQLAESTNDIMKDFGESDKINPEMITTIMKKMGIKDKNINQDVIKAAMDQMNNPNRKMKRLMNKKNK